MQPTSSHHEFGLIVSYAAADDVANDVDSSRPGWVSALADGLNTLLAQKLGVRDWGEMYLSRVAINETPSRTAAQSCDMMLVVLSEAYLRSDECLAELATFADSLKDPSETKHRIVVVARDDVPRSRWPQQIGQLLSWQFFTGLSESNSVELLNLDGPPALAKLFSVRLDDVSVEIASRLQRLAPADGRGEVAPSPTVLLGETTTDLAESRDAVRRYLVQSGIDVLPDTWYPRSEEAFRDAMQTDLQRSHLFVQLLSEHASTAAEQSEFAVASLQAELASTANMQLLAWRTPELDVAQVAELSHREILQGPHVLAVGLEAFKRKIVERAQQAAKPKAERRGAFVLVSADDVDRPLAEQVGTMLDSHGVGYDIPGGAEFGWDKFGNGQGACEGFLIIYGGCPALWVRQQLWRYRKAMARSERRPPICAVFDGPPEAKDAVGYKLPQMDVIDCRSALDEAALSRFIEAVRERSSQ